MQAQKIIRIANMGQVDSGKSRLFFQFSRQMTTFEIPAHDDLVDTLSQEERKKITFAVGHLYRNYGPYRLHFTDDPGHLDLLPVTLSGLWGSELLFYVIDGINPDFELVHKHFDIIEWFGIPFVQILVSKWDLVEQIDHWKFPSKIQDHPLFKKVSAPLYADLGQGVVFKDKSKSLVIPLGELMQDLIEDFFDGPKQQGDSQQKPSLNSLLWDRPMGFASDYQVQFGLNFFDIQSMESAGRDQDLCSFMKIILVGKGEPLAKGPLGIIRSKRTGQANGLFKC